MYRILGDCGLHDSSVFESVMAEVTISKHALGRILERANKWTDSAQNIAWRAYTQGLDFHAMPQPLQAYINAKKKEHIPDCTYKLFNKKLFIYKKKHLITVYPVPSYTLKEEKKEKVNNPKRRIVTKRVEASMSIKRTRKNRHERMRDGQALYDKFFKDPDYNCRISTEDMKDLLTYTGYQSATVTMQGWIDRNKIDVARNHDTGEVESFDGRTAFTLCSAYRTKTITKQLNGPLDANQSVTIVLDPKVKRLFVQMAQKEDITLPTFLSKYLNQIGKEKIDELDRKIQVEVESLRNHYISEVSL